jgi:hypothetical protein
MRGPRWFDNNCECGKYMGITDRATRPQFQNRVFDKLAEPRPQAPDRVGGFGQPR